MKKFLQIAIPILIIGLIATGIIIKRVTSKVKYNTDYVNGNSQGNLYNEGTFCEYDGIIYFANPDDKYKLYSMDLNGNNVKKLCEDTAYYINADENYLYYARNNSVTDSDFFFFSNGNNSLCRLPRKGGTATVLDDAPCMYVSLCGNYIYYLHYNKSTATDLYRIKIDGTEKERISDAPSLTCGALGKFIYYSGIESDGKLYEMNTETRYVQPIINTYTHNPIVVNTNNIYYLDVNNNNRLIHTGLNVEKDTIITNRSIDFYNVYGSYIYFQDYSKKGSGLYMIKNDGSNESIIATGTYKRINITSKYIFFTDTLTNTVYYALTSNPNNIQEFHPGK